jgi:hypothetical protein
VASSRGKVKKKKRKKEKTKEKERKMDVAEGAPKKPIINKG